MVDWQFWSLNFPTDHGGAVTRAARVKAFPTSVRLWITSHAASTDNHGDGHQSGMVLYGGADPPFRGLGDLARQSCNAHECLICFITPNFNRLQCKSVLVAFINSTSVSRSGCKGLTWHRVAWVGRSEWTRAGSDPAKERIPLFPFPPYRANGGLKSKQPRWQFCWRWTTSLASSYYNYKASFPIQHTNMTYLL